MRGLKQFAAEMSRRLFPSAVFLWVSLNTNSSFHCAEMLGWSFWNCGTIAATSPFHFPKSIWPTLLKAGAHEAIYLLLPILDRGVELRRSAVDLLDVENHRVNLGSAEGTKKEILVVVRLSTSTKGRAPTSIRCVYKTVIDATRSSYRMSRCSAINRWVP
jgi:hypothetical protein